MLIVFYVRYVALPPFSSRFSKPKVFLNIAENVLKMGEGHQLYSLWYSLDSIIVMTRTYQIIQMKIVYICHWMEYFPQCYSDGK